MTASPPAPASSPRPQYQRPVAALLGGAGIFAATALFALATHPATQHGLNTYKEYVFTATLIPCALAELWVLTSLHTVHDGRDGGLGRVGLRTAAVGLVALVVDSIVTLGSATTDTLGPLYPLAMLIVLIGTVLLAAAWYRTGTLPGWVGPAIAIGWFLGATPVTGFSGATLIHTVAFVTVAAGLRRQSDTRVGTASQDLQTPDTGPRELPAISLARVARRRRRGGAIKLTGR